MARPFQDHDADIVVVAEILQDLDHAFPHIHRHRVKARRIVERHDPDGAALFGDHLVCEHGFVFLCPFNRLQAFLQMTLRLRMSAISAAL